MATRGVQMTVQFVAWDTANNVGKTGDSGNFTLRWVKDGTSAAPTNASSEVDATNAPGVYKITITSTEAGCDVGTICGKSSTSGVVIIPTTVTFVQTPNAAPGASGGLPTVDSNNAVKLQSGTGANQISLSSGLVTVGTNNDKTDYGLATGAITASVIATDAIDADAIKTDAVSEIVDAIFAKVIENSLSFSTLIKRLIAFAYGKSSGGGTSSLKFRDLTDTYDRITATVDANGNRTGMSYNDT
jgi:hypothetical protein